MRAGRISVRFGPVGAAHNAELMVADERAMAAIYDRHHRGLLSFCRHMLGSREEAEEAVRETFQLARQALERSEEPVDVRPWLYAIARNRCIAMLRAGAAPPHEEALHDLARLPVDERAALLLAEDGELTRTRSPACSGCPTTAPRRWWCARATRSSRRAGR